MPTTFGFALKLIFTFALGVIFSTEAANAAGPELFPLTGSTEVCPDTVLHLTFPTPAIPGKAGKIQVIDLEGDTVAETIDVAIPTSSQSIGGLPDYNYYPIIINGNQADIHLRNGALAYAKTYYVKIDAGAFTGFPGFTQSTDWRFTTKSTPPAAGAAKITVAADGAADFCTVQGAVDFIPDQNTAPTTILIRKGTYTEMVYFANKNAITFQGEDRKQTIIAYATNNIFNNATGGYRRGVFRAKGCTDLTITNLTLHNTTPQGGSQAETIILNGTTKARAILKDVDLYSYQDTLQINGQAYITNCHIEGDVDFLWGTGPCFFENCEFKSLKSKSYFTQIRNPATNHGYVFYHCTLDGAPEVKNVFLSRIAPSTYPASEVVLIDCILGECVGDIAWRLDGAKNPTPDQPPADTSKLMFIEYNSHHADGQPVDVSKRLPPSRQLLQPADAKTIADYSDPAFVLGNDWNPRNKQGDLPAGMP